MRLLFVSNGYPPHATGGYEHLCAEVASAFAMRGHQMCVLTGRAKGGDGANAETGVETHRLLCLEVEAGVLKTGIRLLVARKCLEQENLAHVRALVARFKPDAALIWGMWNVPRSVPAYVEELLGSRVAYYLCDYWPSLPSAYVQHFRVRSHRRLTRIPKRLVGQMIGGRLAAEETVQLRFEHTACVSQALRRLLVDRGLPLQHARVIYGNARPEQFASAAASRPRHIADRLRLLYAGRLAPEKGIEVAIRAMAPFGAPDRVSLDLLGSGSPAYERELRSLVRYLRLQSRVSFRGFIRRSDMVAVLPEYDALIFPSEWDEPFARSVLEAMAAGLVVIGTTTGGTGEVLIDNETGLTFAPGDASGLAQQIHRLLADSDLRQRLAQSAQRYVLEHFTFEQTLDELESFLAGVAEQAAA